MEHNDLNHDRQCRLERVFGSFADGHYFWTLVRSLLLGICIAFVATDLGAERYLPVIGGLVLAGIAGLELVTFRPDSRDW